jgi:hypothetical protein
LNSKKRIGIGDIEDLFFKTRLPYQSDKQPWSDESPENRPEVCDDTTYIPLDAGNSCPIPQPDYLADIDLMTAFVDGVVASPRYYDFSPRWRYWTTQYSLNLPQDFQGTIRFDITQFPLATGYIRDPVQVEGGGIKDLSGAPAANNSIIVSSLKGGTGAEGEWTDKEWSTPTFYKVHFTTTYYPILTAPTFITKEYEVELLRTIQTKTGDLGKSLTDSPVRREYFGEPMLRPLRATVSASPSKMVCSRFQSLSARSKNTEYSTCGGLGVSGNGRTDHCSFVIPRRTGNK